MNNDTSSTPHAVDPSWAIGEIATRFNRPITRLKVFPRDIRPGSVQARAAKPQTAEKLAAIHAGQASKELGKPTHKCDPDDRIDFDNPLGTEAGVSTLKLKATTLPTKEVFLPLVSGSGRVDHAAIEPWRSFIALSTSASQGGLSREIARDGLGLNF